MREMIEVRAKCPKCNIEMSSHTWETDDGLWAVRFYCSQGCYLKNEPKLLPKLGSSSKLSNSIYAKEGFEHRVWVEFRTGIPSCLEFYRDGFQVPQEEVVKAAQEFARGG